MSALLGVGISSEADVFRAGQDAAKQAMLRLDGRAPHLVLVFSSIRFADPRMLRGVRSVTREAPLIGCTDAGSISAAGPHRRSVIVITLWLARGQVATGLGRHLSQSVRVAAESLTNDLRAGAVENPKALFMFPDGLGVDGEEVLRNVESTLGVQLPILGGSAGDDFFFQRTFQYFNDQVLTDAIPGALLGGDVRIGIGARHGWLPLGRPREVTRAKGHVIYQLDGRPAVSIYEDYLGLRKEELMQETLARIAVAYPLGSPVDGHPEHLLRDAIRVGKAGSLICTANVNEGRKVRLMIGGYESALEAAQQAALEAVEEVGRSHMQGAFIFSSVARQKRLGAEVQGEIDVVRDILGGSNVHLGGFFTYGELAPLEWSKGGRRRRRNEFLNECIVVVALG